MAQMVGTQPAKFPKVKLGAGGEVLAVPENRDFLERIDREPLLKPQHLLGLASNYRRREATQGIANHLASEAMKTILKDPKMAAAIRKIEADEVGFSIFGDIWGAIVGFFTGTNPNNPAGTPNPGAQFPCEFKCVGFLVEVLVERCWTGVGDNYGPWHVIGACIGVNF
jgi:hypothetical protein